MLTTRVATGALCALLAATSLRAADELVVGVSAAFKGPSAGLGTELYRGSLACFASGCFRRSLIEVCAETSWSGRRLKGLPPGPLPARGHDVRRTGLFSLKRRGHEVEIESILRGCGVAELESAVAQGSPRRKRADLHRQNR